VEPSCAAKVLHVAPERDTLLVSCKKKNGRMDARLLSGTSSRSLGIELGVAARDHLLGGPLRLVPLHPGSDAVLVDLDTGKLLRLRARDRIVATLGQRALVVRGRQLVLREASGAETLFAGTLDPFARFFRAGSIVAFAPWVVDVSAGRLLGTISSRPLAVATDGRILVATSAPGDATSPPIGPLRWVAPDGAPEPGSDTTVQDP
jgi:hypothetical protein